MPTAVYPGSLDPITFGHKEAIRGTAESFGKAIVAIGINPKKNYMFSLAEREALAQKALADIPGVSVTSFSGLLVHFLTRNNLKTVVRGVRNGGDLDDAMLQEIVGWQQNLGAKINAFYIPARPGQSFISSTALKGVLAEQGDVSHMAPLSTIHATQARLMGQYLYGVTGASGAGKSRICSAFAAIAQKRNIPLLHIDVDKIGHQILGNAEEPLYVETRKQIMQAFGTGILDSDGVIDRAKLGEQVFGNPKRLKVLNEIIHGPVFFRMNDMLRGRKGICLIDAALLAETCKTTLGNNHVLLVKANKADIAARLAGRDYLKPAQIARRMSSQFTAASKIKAIKEKIKTDCYGHLNILENGANRTEAETERAFDTMLQQVDIFGELRIKGFFTSLGVADPDKAYTDLLKLYSGNDRFYHAMSHIVDGLNQLPDIRDQIQDKDAFALGWLFHDAVYDTHRKDNEERSAELLEKFCTTWGINPITSLRAKRFVMVSKHGVVKANTMDEKLFVDLDMSVLGKPAAAYDHYEQNVRREYGWVSSKDWKQGRGDFLASQTAPFFHTPHFEERYGAQAQDNIQRSIARLSDTKSKITPTTSLI